jgi:uncharacterized damage-inducible protein DinB
MTEKTAKGLLDFLLPQLREEFATTRRVLAAVPADQCGYKPNEKSMSALELATHIATSESFFLNGVTKGEFEWKNLEFKDPAAALAYYEETIPGLLDQVSNLTGKQLSKMVNFAIWREPAITFLNLYLKHSVHHRGQLSAYLRPMGAKVPRIYGPSADEPQPAVATSGGGA